MSYFLSYATLLETELTNNYLRKLLHDWERKHLPIGCNWSKHQLEARKCPIFSAMRHYWKPSLQIIIWGNFCTTGERKHLPIGCNWSKHQLEARKYPIFSAVRHYGCLCAEINTRNRKISKIKEASSTKFVSFLKWTFGEETLYLKTCWLFKNINKRFQPLNSHYVANHVSPT